MNLLHGWHCSQNRPGGTGLPDRQSARAKLTGQEKARPATPSHVRAGERMMVGRRLSAGLALSSGNHLRWPATATYVRAPWCWADALAVLPRFLWASTMPDCRPGCRTSTLLKDADKANPTRHNVSFYQESIPEASSSRRQVVRSTGSLRRMTHFAVGDASKAADRIALWLTVCGRDCWGIADIWTRSAAEPGIEAL